MWRFRVYLVCLSLTVVAGCVWAPQSELVPSPFIGIDYQVQQTRSRSLDGAEHTATIVTPVSQYAEYGYNSSGDSVLYIIVNGDTAYRHPVSGMPPQVDSAAPFHLDGTLNTVVIIYPSAARADTTYPSGFLADIASPAIGDTLSRTEDVSFTVRTQILEHPFVSGNFNLTDSIGNFSILVNTDQQQIGVTASKLAGFRPGTVWAELHLHYYLYDDWTTNNHLSSVRVDRIVPYILK
ncbi:MAG: hypothetical protein Q8922_06545 [Bacteroidota bacterium]|nr:hypothetical protein [Bacteroidota bacterium]MDP4232746.1 hypothetical protein [Bacteroidota bacterium]MDP4244062.1 hypothetical protein [Bacteroidota bacterium]MDP4287578.1 hypothetical protein [Bacteroidota bacterium]